MLTELSKFLEVDKEKQYLIDEVLNLFRADTFKKHYLKLCKPDFDELRDMEFCEDMDYQAPLTKFCPNCNKKYPDDENVCYDCLVSLKYISDKTPIQEIRTNPVFTFSGKNDLTDFETILNQNNVIKVKEFDFDNKSFNKIIKNIKKISLTNLDNLIKEYNVDLDDITTRNKVLLFAKSFVDVEFKSYGQELGYFENNTIFIDDRQSDSFQITTLIHELSHFLLREIISEILSKLLDCNKNNFIDVISTFILSYSNFTNLVDEYSAHCCEGRFTVYGYQDYSSFLNIVKSMDGEMSKEEIEITKSIGNTFANSIKNILETFIDDDLLNDIKEDFLIHRQDVPNYEMLKLENCERLTDEGFMKAIWLIVSDGFEVACANIDKLEILHEDLK